MKARLLLLCVAVAGLSACGDPTSLEANLETVEDTITVFAFSGTPINVPTALNTIEHVAVRAEAGSNFDVVFDITPAGDAQIIPPSLIAALGNAAVARSTVPYDDLLLAPNAGYDDTEALTIVPGDVVVIRAVSVPCVGRINQFIYSKLVVDSVNVPNRTIHFRMRVNPNCGFRSFAPGVPTE